MSVRSREEKRRSIIQCAACGGSLSDHGASFVCAACGASHPRVQDAVCFVPVEQAHPPADRPDSFVIRIKNAVKRFPRLYQALTYIFGISYAGLTPKAFLDDFGPDAVIVTLGAGIERRNRDEIHVDLFTFPGVDILAGISRLPIKTGSVDAVIIQSVIEHVERPGAVFSEIARILRAGGRVYMTAPLMYPYHSSPNDYFRFTLDGLRTLGDRFGLKTVSAGVRHGATSALALQFAYWIAIPFSLGIHALYDLVVILVSAVCMPVAHIFDFFLSRLKVSANAAAGYYYVGERNSTPPSLHDE